MADKSDVKKTVIEYVNDDDRYAIMVTGDWGCGKTWLIENDLRRALSYKGWKLARVSLFGISSAEELNARIVASRAREYLPRAGDADRQPGNAQSSGGWLSNTLIDNLQSAVEKKTGISINLTAGLLASALTWSKTLLVLDDLERRAPGSDDALFGQINNLVEGQGVKILFLCNMEKDDGVEKVFDKLIWRRVHYIPDMEEHVDLMLKRIKGTFPEGLHMKQHVLSALDATHCQNIREIWKLRRMLQSLCSCEFTSDEGIPAYSRGAMLEDTLRLCLEYSSQLNQHEADNQPDKDDDPKEKRQKEVPTVESLLARGDATLLASLPFVRDYYEDGTSQDINEMSKVLKEQARQRYPFSDICQQALEAEQRFRQLKVEDDEAMAIGATIVRAFTSEEIPPALLPRMVATITILRDIGLIGGTEIEMCMEHAREILASDLYESRRAVAYDPISWQMEGQNNREDHIDEIDDLRRFVMNLAPTEQADKLELERFMASEPDSACARLANHINTYMDTPFVAWACAEVAPPVVAACVQTSDVVSICCLKASMTMLSRNPKPWNGHDVSGCAHWAQEVARALDGVEIGSPMRQYHARELRECFAKGAEELFGQLPDEA